MLHGSGKGASLVIVRSHFPGECTCFVWWWWGGGGNYYLQGFGGFLRGGLAVGITCLLDALMIRKRTPQTFENCL